MNHMTGEQALAYCRDRFSDGTSDFGRTERQRKVLMAMLESTKKLSPLEMNNLLQEILKMNILTTDMTDNQLITFTKTILPKLSGLKVESLRIPADGLYYDDTRDGMSVLIPDLEKNKELLTEKIMG